MSIQLKTLLKWLLLVVVIVGISIIIFFLKPRAKQELVLVHNPIIQEEEIGIPVRLKIPDINVDASLDIVGLTSKGAVDVPAGPINAAWFNLGPRPGEIGISIIDGHSGFKNAIASVFDNLHKLKRGDKIYVESDKGETISFIVVNFKTYSYNDDVTDVFISNDQKAHLNLITCTGSWNKDQKSPYDRFVVFSDKE